MSEIHLTATAGPDGVLHLEIPVGAPGEYDVWITPKRKPTPEELGWPPAVDPKAWTRVSTDGR